MKFRAWLGAIAALLAPLAAFAFVPESGFYQQYTTDNGSKGGGTGIAIEIQNEYLFAAGYVFSANGAPTFVTMQGFLLLQTDGSWLLSTSPSNASNGLVAYSGGQCIGTTASCPYKKPTPAKIGDFAIQFFGENSATLTWGATGNTASSTLRRFSFYTGAESGREYISLSGQWDLLIARGVAADGIDYEGDRLIFNSYTNPDSSGNSTVIGCVANNDGSATCSTHTLVAHVTPCVGSTCAGKSHYDVTVLNSTGKIIRVHSFDSNVGAGSFTRSFYGTTHFCPAGVSTIALCVDSTAHFNAYRSGDAQFANYGVGMSQP